MARYTIHLPEHERLPQLLQAETWLKEALQYRDRQIYPDLHAQTLCVLGDLYLSKVGEDRVLQLNKALELFQEALRYYNRDRRKIAVAETLASVGKVYGQLSSISGDNYLVQALQAYDQALAYCSSELHPLPYARILVQKAETYTMVRSGNRIQYLRDALHLLEQALSVLTRETAPREFVEARIQQGVTYIRLPLEERAENLNRAIEAFKDVQEMALFADYPEHEAVVHHYLGMAYAILPHGDRQINLKQAEEEFQAARERFSPNYTPDGYAQTLIGLAQVRLLQYTSDRPRQIKRAISLMEEALLYVRKSGNRHSFADLQIVLGRTYSELLALTGEGANEAQNCFVQAASVYRDSVAPVDYAAILVRQAEIRLLQQDANPIQSAQSAIEQFLAKAERFAFHRKDDVPNNYAEVLEYLGRAHQRMIDFDADLHFRAAVKYYNNSLEIWTPKRAPEACRRVSQLLADIFWTHGQWDKALDNYLISIDAGEQLYRAGILTVTKRSEVSKNISSYMRAAYAAACIGNSLDAMLLLNQGKTRLLSEALNLRLTRPPQVPESVWQIYERASETIRAIHLDQIYLHIDDTDTLQSDIAHPETLLAARQSLDSAIVVVQNYDPTFLRSLQKEDIEKLLTNKNVALVAFCISDKDGFAFIANQSLSGLVKSVKLAGVSSESLNQFVVGDISGKMGRGLQGWWDQYQQYRSSNRSDTLLPSLLQSMNSMLEHIGTELIEPLIANMPQDVSRILFIPTGPLHLVPLHAVPVAALGNQPLAVKYTIRYVPSVQLLSNRLYDLDRSGNMSLGAVIDPRRNLPFAPIEGAHIAPFFEQATLIQDRAATIDNVIESLQGKKYIHLACHGEYIQQNPGESYIECADSTLTLNDLQRGVVDLSGTSLAVMSACETSLVDVFLGSSEEFIGLPAGFLLAGVSCVVGSLWKVPDVLTALLMERFYSNHLHYHMDIAEALSKAQQSVSRLSAADIAAYAQACRTEVPSWYPGELTKTTDKYRSLVSTNSEPPFSHPYYWAAFLVYSR
jgi:CHAT domain-containing protein/tetratricopeptide (TPR) repeat protein